MHGSAERLGADDPERRGLGVAVVGRIAKHLEGRVGCAWRAPSRSSRRGPRRSRGSPARPRAQRSSATRTSASIARRTAARPAARSSPRPVVFALREALHGKDDGRPQASPSAQSRMRSASAMRPFAPSMRVGQTSASSPSGGGSGSPSSTTIPSEEPLVERGDAGSADRSPDRLHERLGRPLDRRAGDERADGDDRRGGGRDRFAHARYGEDRPDRDHRVRRADHDQVRLGERGEHLGRRACIRQAFDLDALDRRLALVEDQELLEAAPVRRASGPRVRTGSSHIGRTRPRRPGPLAICAWAAVSVPPSAMKWVR